LGTDFVQVSFGSSGDSRRRQNGDIMVFAAVPKDVTIEKLTGPEKRALDEYLGKETRKSIFERIAGNEKVPLLIAGGAVLVSAPTILRLIFDALAKQKNGVELPTGIDYLTFTKDFAEAIFEISGPAIGDPFGTFEGEAADFWTKYVKK
jgi:hypothetical protein